MEIGFLEISMVITAIYLSKAVGRLGNAICAALWAMPVLAKAITELL